MNRSVEDTLCDYRQNISTLFESVKNWIEDLPLSTKEESIELIEELGGRYSINKLALFNKNNALLAELVPAGAWVIGAKGRVDLIGKYEREILVYLEASPSLRVSCSTPESTEKLTHSLYKGIEREDWYWIESKRLMKARAVSQELFLDLLAEVSDYEFTA